jgi:hypothetical protein
MISHLALFFNEATPGEFLTVMSILAFLVAMGLGVKSLIKREPPLHREFVLRDDCEKQHLTVTTELTRQAASRKGIYEKIEEMDERAAVRTDALRKEVKDDIRGVHDRINDVLHALGRLEGKHE